MLDRKYERQMSGKEKRKFEAEKMRQMTLKEKIEYLWMYYKIIFLIPVIIGVVIYLGVTMYQGITREVLLNLTITGGTGTELTDLEEDVLYGVPIPEEDFIDTEIYSIRVEPDSSNSDPEVGEGVAFATSDLL